MMMMMTRERERERERETLTAFNFDFAWDPCYITSGSLEIKQPLCTENNLHLNVMNSCFPLDSVDAPVCVWVGREWMGGCSV